MKRGDLVTIAVSGDYGKPRPALVVQANAFDTLASVTVLRLTSELHDWPTFRVTIAPTPENKLRVASQVMIDKASTISRVKARETFGRLDMEIMLQIERLLALFVGIVK